VLVLLESFSGKRREFATFRVTGSSPKKSETSERTDKKCRFQIEQIAKGRHLFARFDLCSCSALLCSTGEPGAKGRLCTRSDGTGELTKSSVALGSVRTVTNGQKVKLMRPEVEQVLRKHFKLYGFREELALVACRSNASMRK
jgi:hypothetical protein